MGYIVTVAAMLVLALPFAALETAARAELKDRQGRAVGRAELTDGPRGVLVHIRLDGVPQGEHALHVHSVGSCEAPDFESAGDHFNPTGTAHGVLSSSGGHLGDLPNVHVSAAGTLELEYFIAGVSLQGEHRLLDGDGAAVVLHAKPDDYRSDPAGASGDRIACGVIAAPGKTR